MIPVPGKWQAPSRLTFAVLATVVLFVLFARLGERGLLETSEARYAETAREIYLSGNWRDPAMFGILHFEKPPLTVWITALGYRLFGVNELGARFFLAVGGGLLVLVVYWLGATWFNERTGFVAAGILSTSPLFVVFARILTIDLFVTLAATAAIAGFTAGTQGRRAGFLGMWAALAAGFLLKGPLAIVIAAAALGPIVLIRRDARALRQALTPAGIVLFAAIALPWFLLHPGLLWKFLYYENFGRLTTSAYDRPGPSYYYAVVLLAGFFPWSAFGPAVAVRGWLHWRKQRAGWETALLTWFAVPLLLFSASRSKLPAYILPVLPALALLAARWLDDIWDEEGAHRLATLPVLAGGLGAALAAGLTLVILRPAELERLTWHLALAIPVLLFWCFGAHVTGRSRRLEPLVAATAAAALYFPVLLAPFADRAEGGMGSLKPLALAVRRVAGPETPVVLCHIDANSIPFYLERPIYTYGRGGNPNFEIIPPRERPRHMDNQKQFLSLLAKGPVVLIGERELLHELNLEQWRQSHRSLRLIARSSRCDAVTSLPMPRTGWQQ